MKRMMHPQHGFHHPMNSGDREAMLKNGWVDEPDVLTLRVVEVTDASSAIAPAIVPEKRKPGPKPKAK